MAAAAWTVRSSAATVGPAPEKTRLTPWLAKLEAQLYSNRADHVMDNFTLRTFAPGGSMSMPMASNVKRDTSGARVAATLQWQQDCSRPNTMPVVRRAHDRPRTRHRPVPVWQTQVDTRWWAACARTDAGLALSRRQRYWGMGGGMGAAIAPTTARVPLPCPARPRWEHTPSPQGASVCRGPGPCAALSRTTGS